MKTCGDGGIATKVSAGDGGNRPAIGEQDAADGSLYFRFGTATPSEGAAEGTTA